MAVSEMSKEEFKNLILMLQEIAKDTRKDSEENENDWTWIL